MQTKSCFNFNKIVRFLLGYIFKFSLLNRFTKLKRFEFVSNTILIDILECLAEGESSIPQLIAIKPLLIDIRKFGIKLLEEQKPLGKFLYNSRESSLYPKLKYLLELENIMKKYEKKYFDNFKEIAK